ncbi:MAG: hypothetical protein Q4P14_04620 [Methanobacteriaceae archaeon]|nr:hypothetical protein [Methanobacteriaceae archaeon]
MKITKIILIIILFIAFFEIGLFSSYTIVSGEIPDVQNLITMQTDALGSFFSSENVGSVLIKDPTEINVTNRYDLAHELTKRANIDGVTVNNMTITTENSYGEENITIKIDTFGFSAPDSTSGQIVIENKPDYKVVAVAKATYSWEGYTVDINTIKIVSILKMYEAVKNTTAPTKTTTSSSKDYSSYSEGLEDMFSSSKSKSASWSSNYSN